MTSRQNTKIRLVKCPKCRRVLPELADLPVYQCGGCGTVLQAKIRRNDLQNTRLALPETGTVHSNELERVSKDEGSSGTSQSVNFISEENCSLDQNNMNNQNESGRDQLEVLNFPEEVSSSVELTCHETVDSSVVAGGNSEVDENDTRSSNLGSSSSDNLQATGIRSPETTADKPVVERTASSMLVSPFHEQLEESQKSVHGFDRVRPTVTLGTTELINGSSELSDAFGDMSKSPATRNDHAYDGSISSWDGTDDQVPDPNLRLYGRTFGAGEFVHVQESFERGQYPADKMMGRNIEMQNQARNSFSSDKMHYTMKYSVCDSDEPMELLRHGHQMRLNDYESPVVPFYVRSSQAVFENGSPSSHWHDEFQCNSSFCSPDNPEQEKIKLLRMVYELQDQLDRTHIGRGQAHSKVLTGAAWKEKQNPTYYNHEARTDEIYHDLSYPRYPRRYMQGENWPHPSTFSQMPFTGEATNRRLQVDTPYSHCYPPDRQCSVQLSPPVHCCNKGMCRVHPGHNCYSVHNSRPSTSQSHINSEVPLRGSYTKSDDQIAQERYMDSYYSLRGHDAISDDQRHKDDGPNKFCFREKHHLVKRHFRPIAGGAPFITCYHCLKPLQLPADFLLFKRRCHQLRCGACSKVLKFSLQSSSHILPYALGAIDPSSGGVEESGQALNMRSLASASETNDWPHADPVSCSDDYGETFRKSCSTEGERVYLTSPFRAFQGNADQRNMLSSSSFEPVEQRKKMPLFKQSVKSRNPGNTCESAGPSSNEFDMEKLSSEIEELAPKTGSPLHRLMGYNSPGEVIKGSGEGTNLYK